MNPYLSRAVVSAAFASIFNTHAGLAPDSELTEIERSLAKISSPASSAFYKGSPSSDFSHLLSSPAEPKDLRLRLSTTLGSLKDKDAPAISPFSSDYRYELGNLAQICPALHSKNHNTFDTLAWSQKYVATPDLPSFRRDFIEALYFTIARQPDSNEKFEAITRLNLVLPDSPAMLDYLDRKRTELQNKLETDDFLKRSNPKENWHKLSDANKTVVLDYVARLTLQTLLPGKTIDYPRTFLLSKKILGSVDGLYFADFNEIYTNKDHAGSYVSAVETTIHEAFHAFQSMVAKWYEDNEIEDNSQLKRQGKLYYINFIKDGSGIAHNDNYLGYRLGVNERAAWAFQLAGTNQKLSDFTIDTFTNVNRIPATKYTDPPIYRHDKTEGRLPAACLE